MSMTAPRLLPSPPQTQARSSRTFRPPPVDGSLSLPELYDWHLENTPNHRLFLYAKDDGSVRTIYWPEAVMAIHTGARVIRDRMGWEPGMEVTPVIAILAASDAVAYFTLIMSIIRANYAAFPISPRNSATAVADLISKVGVKHILVGREQAMLDLAKDALDILKIQYPSMHEPKLSPVLLFEELFLPPSEATMGNNDLPYEYKGPDAPAVILHSSGSTAFPKPITWTNHRFAQLALIPWFGERDLTDQVVSLHAVPMYHGIGVFQLCWTASSGLVLSVFEPKYPPQIPTPDGIFNAAKATNSDFVLCPPTFVEAWSRNPEYMKWFSTRGGVLSGGGPLNKESGDNMTSHGVSVFVFYGATECGMMSPVVAAEAGHDWEYFRFSGLVTPKLIPHEDNTFELVIVSNEFCRPSVLNTKVDGIDAYATSDLLAPHPSKAGYWKVFGRTDDQIMHSSSEKTNPGPLENILNQDPRVLASVMFGRGRFQAGVLVEPRKDFKFNPSDEAKLAEFRNKIWPTVEKMNAYAPQHSRLFKEMIIVAKPSKPFAYTAKNTARRQAIINEYECEINALYDAVDESMQVGIPPPANWDIPAATDFVRTVVSKVLVHKVCDEDDLFQHGCDSLQATWIRNSLFRALRNSAKLDTRKMVNNFVYDHPSIVRLASFVSALAFGASSDGDMSNIAKVNAMHAMVDKYTHDFHNHQVGYNVPKSNGDVVLITGTTGSLGCYVLAQLVSDIEVSRVYALNRITLDGTSLHERQKLALADRGLNPVILDSEKVVLLEGDLTSSRFGLRNDTYQDMLNTVTHIIHNAWRVDFNLALMSFEPNVKGLRCLIDFALSVAMPEPARLIYTSSIGVFQNVVSSEALVEGQIEAESAIGTGYAESKWACEQILFEAAVRTSLKPLVVRVGQLCGGLNGAWNANEWLPSLVQSAGRVRCLPDDEKEVSWIPLHAAAAALVDFCRAPNIISIVHLVHPRPVPWSFFATIVSSELSIPLVPYKKWLAELEKIATNISQGVDEKETQADENFLEDLHAIRLLPFFKSISMKASSGNAMGFQKLAVTQAVASSPTLARPEFPQLGANDVRRWLNYWRRVGLLAA